MKKKTVYVCRNCDHQTSSWLGRCPACGAFNTLEEETFEVDLPTDDKKSARRTLLAMSGDSEPIALSGGDIPEYMRVKTGMAEFDRVLGGGIVSGSVILLSGEPGIGKSTLLLQLCSYLAGDGKLLYVSGEESAAQISMRAKRLGIKSGNIFVLTETDAEKVIKKAEKLAPKLVVVDSIQTMYHSQSAAVPGSVTQIRESAAMFISAAKASGTSVVLVGHINKEGGIAGPKILEHMVDTVLYFEGERRQNFRLIRAMKNRFGSSSEIGVFEMTDKGLCEVENPSQMLLSDRP
ncbi:MAG: DNA repair protein RadA, partial [Clostridia bacterium]|nr:DNA repair protein RadA [Clostridia bacterium]